MAAVACDAFDASGGRGAVIRLRCECGVWSAAVNVGRIFRRCARCRATFLPYRAHLLAAAAAALQSGASASAVAHDLLELPDKKMCVRKSVYVARTHNPRTTEGIG